MSTSLPKLLFHVPSVVSVLDAPVVAKDGKSSVSHYARSYYVVATDAADAVALIQAEERKHGGSTLDFDSPVAISVALAPLEVRGAMMKERGVKWKSGRAFFPNR